MGKETQLIDWRSDPFCYRAFKLAVHQLLEALTPPGKPESKSEIAAIATKIAADRIELPRFFLDLVGEAAHDPAAKRFADSWKNPEARAEYAVDWVLSSFRTARSEPDRELAREHAERVGLQSLWREFYGMPEAAKDLQLKEQTRRKK